MKLSVSGFTLIELLVVTAIISVLAVMGAVNFKDTSAEQIIVKAVGQIQTQLRYAQSNATSGTMCAGAGASSWYLTFASENTIELNCNTGASPKQYTLENVKTAITGDSGCSIPIPAVFSYSSGVGKQTISSAGATSACLQSSTITISVTNTKNPEIAAKTLKVSSGGGINVK